MQVVIEKLVVDGRYHDEFSSSNITCTDRYSRTKCREAESVLEKDGRKACLSTSNRESRADWS